MYHSVLSCLPPKCLTKEGPSSRGAAGAATAASTGVSGGGGGREGGEMNAASAVRKVPVTSAKPIIRPTPYGLCCPVELMRAVSAWLGRGPQRGPGMHRLDRRAGPAQSLLCACRHQDGWHGLQDDPDVTPERAGLDVFLVQRDPLGIGGVAAAAR